MLQPIISFHGAEMTHLCLGDRNLLWCGDAAFWGRRAPILFPIVGNLAGGCLRIGGREYPMKQHGFARDSRFEIIEQSICDIRMRLRSTSELLQSYPYNFELTAHYHIGDDALRCCWEVRNLGDEVMYYQIGAHPAFNIPDFDRGRELQGYVLLNSRDGSQHEIALLPDTFANDALIFEDEAIDEAILCDRDRQPYLAVRCTDAQVWGVWAPYKPGCPFVCLEPWRGRKDAPDFRGDISQREYIQSLEPQAAATFEYDIAAL